MFEFTRMFNLFTYVDLVQDHNFLAIGFYGVWADICYLHMEKKKELVGGLMHALFLLIL